MRYNHPQMLLTCIISILSLQVSPVSLSQVADNIISCCVETESEHILIKECEIASEKGMENNSDVRELFLKVPMTGQEFKELSTSQNSDGSWPDINYTDEHKGIWQPSLHAIRIHRLAIKYCQTKNPEVLSCVLKAIDYWSLAPLKYNNWWHKEIGIPRLLGPAFVMLKDKMDRDQLKAAISIMSSSHIYRSGQNKVWLAGNVLIRSILEDDIVSATQARDAILSELHFSNNEEGIQPDYSFHQHGPQFQSGNYGLSFALSMSFWAKVLKGTGLDFPQEHTEFLRAYIQNALACLVWKGRMDPNACARQVFPNTLMGKALCIRYAALNMGVNPDSGQLAIYYPYSDYGIYRSKDWYASVRMQSSRTIGFETTNSENMKGYFSSDGALLVRVSGDEYDDIWPVWNWHHVPGVTSWNDGYQIWGKRNGNGARSKWPYNRSEKVAGLVKDGYMIAAMDYDRDSLTCRKAWFFFEQGIICLGAGITRSGSAVVTTAVEQNRLKGRILHGKDFIRHRNISYFTLSNSSFNLKPVLHKGSWSWMSPALPDETVTDSVFEIVIDHGANPRNADYVYAVIPGKTLAFTRKVLKKIEIHENTDCRQCVSVDGKIMTVVWEPFSLHIE